MFTLLADANVTWHLIPMTIVISLVYSASRFELPEAIVRHAVWLFIRILLFMGVVLIMLILLSMNL
jgi:hypothetical protein